MTSTNNRSFFHSRVVLGPLMTITLGATPVMPLATAHASVTRGPIEVDTSDRARQLNLEGQRRFNEQDFEGAAAAWIRILEVLPENATNREERDNTLLITLEAYKEASRRVAQGAGDDAVKREVEVLRKALAVRDGYVADFQRAYASETVSNAVVESGDEVERMLAVAERKLGTTSASAPKRPIIETAPKDTSDIFHAPRGPSGNGLIAGGAVLIALGLGSTSMIIVGALQAKAAKGDYRHAQKIIDDAGRRDADHKGRRANGLIAGGAVMTGVFLAAGATMLGIGIRRRVRYQAFAPVVGPQYVGIGWQGRF